MPAAHIAGRFIKFEMDVYYPSVPETFTYEFEIISGTVTDVADRQEYLPVGRQIKNIVTHGRLVTYQFRGVLLAGLDLPWNTRSSPSVTFKQVMTPSTQVRNLYVTLNRGGTSTEDNFYDEVYHYSYRAQVVSMDHVFDTGTHQIFDVTIMADGYYEEPNGYNS